MKKTENDAVS